MEPKEIRNLVHAVEEELHHVSDFLEHTQKRQNLECREYHNHEVNHNHEELSEVVIFISVQRWHEVCTWLDHSDRYLYTGCANVELIDDVPPVLHICRLIDINLLSLNVDEVSHGQSLKQDTQSVYDGVRMLLVLLHEDCDDYWNVLTNYEEH